MTDVLNVLAVVAIVAAWIYCERHHVDPIEAAGNLVQWVERTITRRHS